MICRIKYAKAIATLANFSYGVHYPFVILWLYFGFIKTRHAQRDFGSKGHTSTHWKYISCKESSWAPSTVALNHYHFDIL